MSCETQPMCWSQLGRLGGCWGQKVAFLAQKAPFWAISARKQPAEQPNRHLRENRSYPKLPQNMGKLWSHWVRSVWGKISGIYGRSVEKNWFLGLTWICLGQNPLFCHVIQIFCHHHDQTPKRQGFCFEPVARGTSGRSPGPIFGPKIFIFYATSI